ncbi:cupin domain-containing protein [Kitasatospora sp. NPDC096077]|uniref:JmjC domain-containing protein n=1 Tax=Kitasatospora sp. NPDC096077 TaxID=3155544 RepID=UPI00332B1201
MSLHQLLGARAGDLLHTCPTEPRLYRRERATLDQVITLDLMNTYIDHGLTLPALTAAVRNGRAVHPGRFSEDGRMSPGKLRGLIDDGHTVNLRKIQTVMPQLAEFWAEIQVETGYTLYVSAIITPAGETGLTHHWDQTTVLVAQMAGRKHWPLWAPVVRHPMDNYLDSPTEWTEKIQEIWDNTEPFTTFTLEPGDTLVVPRGWVHAPTCTGDEPSFHLTFALRERTPLDLAHELIASAVDCEAFRRGLAPAQLRRESLGDTLNEVREMVTTYLDGLDMDQLVDRVGARLANRF